MKPRVLFLSGRETAYIRNRVLLAALRRHFQVTVLTIEPGGILTRSLRGILRWVASHPPYDVIIAGFYGQIIALILAILQHKPVILDAFVSTYETLCEDRRIFHPQSPPGRLAYWLDRKPMPMPGISLSGSEYRKKNFG